MIQHRSRRIHASGVSDGREIQSIEVVDNGYRFSDGESVADRLNQVLQYNETDFLSWIRKNCEKIGIFFQVQDQQICSLKQKN